MTDNLIYQLEREIASIKHSILNGACPDYTTYREQIGSLKAFEVAIELTKKSVLDDEDDEDAG